MPPREIDELRDRLNSLKFDRNDIVSFKGLPVMERAFFPGGNGLFGGPGADLPPRGTLILGSNFGSAIDFIRDDGKLVRLDETRSSNTWKGLNRILTPKTGIRLAECFFTNCWPFLHIAAGNETKGLTRAWLADRKLMQNCLLLFEATLSLVKPRLIVSLGPPSAAFVGHFWSEELAIWRDNSISSIDSCPIQAVTFSGMNLVCTAVTHPSHSNSWRRQSPHRGTEGEISLLAKAAARAGLVPGVSI